MTAQASEGLLYKGKMIGLFSEPLNGYIAQLPDIDFKAPHTACWRGYIGTWELKQGPNKDWGLYLIELTAYLQDFTKVGLNYLFPNAPKEGVFAHWYTGDLRCPQGELLEYVHMGYASKYESNLILSIEKGVLIGEKVLNNNPPEDALKSPSGMKDFQLSEYLKKFK